MRVGFITQLLWPRYGTFWTRMVAACGAEVVFPDPETLYQHAQDSSLHSVTGVTFRLAVLQALALSGSSNSVASHGQTQRLDAIVVPSLNAFSPSRRGSAQNPWVSSFPEALRTLLPALPPLIEVPTTLDLSASDLEAWVMKTLVPLTGDAHRVRRAWGQHHHLLSTSATPKSVSWRVAQQETVGVVAPPWLLQKPVLIALAAREPNAHVISQDAFLPRVLKEEGQRLDDGLISTDLETLGAANLLSRKGAVSRLIMLFDETSSSESWLAHRVSKTVHKPVQLIALQTVLSGSALAEALMPPPPSTS